MYHPDGIGISRFGCTDACVVFDRIAGDAAASRHVPAVRERRARVPRQRPGQARDARPHPPPRHHLQVYMQLLFGSASLLNFLLTLIY